MGGGGDGGSERSQSSSKWRGYWGDVTENNNGCQPPHITLSMQSMWHGIIFPAQMHGMQIVVLL